MSGAATTTSVSKLRIVSYAINGRGLGHLTRQLAILRWVRRLCAVLDVRCECWVLTTSEADTLARREGFCALKMPSKAMLRDADIAPTRYLCIARTWVLDVIASLQPDVLLVDTFPGGSFGELVAALELVPHRVLVRRRVKDSYSQDKSYNALMPLYSELIVPGEAGRPAIVDAQERGRHVAPILIREREELLPREQARAALGIEDERRAVYVTLGGGGYDSTSSMLLALVDALVPRGWHVVVGAGPLYVGPERRGPHITWLERYTPVELLAGVDAAVSAGGYNAFHELMFAGVPTVFLPQPRIADDQRARVEAAQRAGAGRVAASIDEVAELLDAPGCAAAARALVETNGARDAATALLSRVLPAEHLALANAVLSPPLMRALRRVDERANDVLALVRIFAGGTPAELAADRTALARLVARGRVDEAHAEVGDDRDDTRRAGEHIEAFVALIERERVPLDTALALITAISRKFPAARGAALLEAAHLCFAAWAPFDDWMGAVQMLRAVPLQREADLVEDFARPLATWLAGCDDLFDALRELSHLEGAGRRPIAEVLGELAQRATAPPATAAKARR
ncbi:MAG: hypothetical protein KC503_15120 [Myxococcales bacterium]|nr:hypothetical protein [Myxococcales bacterium]